MEDKELDNQEEKKTLPSRRSIHTGNKRKWKTPIISSLAVLFILLPISILGINSLLKSNGLPALIPSEATSSFFEQVSITQESKTLDLKKNNTEKEVEKEEPVQDLEKVESMEGNDSTDNLPSTAESEKSTEEMEAQPEEQQIDTEVVVNSSVDGTIIYHQVKKGETLFEIALKYYPAGDGMEKIKASNNLKTNEIQAGQTLKIVVN